MVVLFVLVSDMFGSLLPPGIMNFVVPGAVAAGLFVFILYKILRSWGLIEGL